MVQVKQKLNVLLTEIITILQNSSTQTLLMKQKQYVSLTEIITILWVELVRTSMVQVELVDKT